MVVTGLEEPWVGGAEGFRQAFDPLGNFESKDQELIGSLLEMRKIPVSTTLIRGLGEKALHVHKAPSAEPSPEPEEFSGRQLLAREAIHLGLMKNEVELKEIADLLGMSEEEMTETQTDAIRKIDTEVDQAVRFFDAIRSDPARLDRFSRIVGVKLGTNSSKVVVAGVLLPVALHEGIQRQNRDMSPYYTHPIGTGALYNIATKRVISQLKQTSSTVELPEADDLYTQEFRNYVHDSIEEIIRNGDTPLFHGNRTQLTPLAQKRLLIKLGIADDKANDIVRDSVLVTKSRDVQGDSFSKEVYTKRTTLTIGAELTKLSDLMYNWFIDPKVLKDPEAEDRARRKNVVYKNMVREIMRDLKNNKQDEFGYLVAVEIIRTAYMFRGNVWGFSEHLKTVELGHYPELQVS